MVRILAVCAAALGLVFPVAAHAGTVTRDASAITYTADAATGAGEQVSVGIENALAYVTSERGVTSSSCTETSQTRVDCDPSPLFVVRLLGFDDSVSGDAVIGAFRLEAYGLGGRDNLSGTVNADTLDGGLGDDYLDGKQGNDVLRGGEDSDNIDGGDGADVIEGGPADDYLADGPGDDAIDGGPGNDSLRLGTGRDTFAGGEGNDRVDYEARTAALTITLDGQPDDGESGEGDNVGHDVEEAAGGSGNDRIVGSELGNVLSGRGGDDTIVAGAGEDRVEGNEGNDTIDTRDGVYDSVDCGPGNDVVYADIGDGTTGCEIAPDVDGDGSIPPEDCAPNDPAVHPGAGEVYGNAIDEDCKDGPAYLRVVNPISYGIAKRRQPTRVRFVRLRVTEVQAGDRIEVRCRGKGCPFTRKVVIGRAGRPAVDVAALLKKRYLRPGAVVEIRILRANQIGKVQRFQVRRAGTVRSTGLCLPVGASAPARCA